MFNDLNVYFHDFSKFRRHPYKNPVSIISTKNVHKMVVLSGNIIPIRKFEVKGSKGKYMIIKNNNHYSCECIGFKYTSKCKHITAVIKSLTKSTA